jgi:nucleolar protein 58
VDALTDADGKSTDDAPTIGLENRAKLESRLRALEHEADGTATRRTNGQGPKQSRAPFGAPARTYNDAADAPALVSAQREPMEVAVAAVLDVKEEKRKAKEERRAKRRAEKEKASENGMEVDEAGSDDGSEKKRKRRESAVEDVQMLVSAQFFGSILSVN